MNEGIKRKRGNERREGRSSPLNFRATVPLSLLESSFSSLASLDSYTGILLCLWRLTWSFKLNHSSKKHSQIPRGHRRHFHLQFHQGENFS